MVQGRRRPAVGPTAHGIGHLVRQVNGPVDRCGPGAVNIRHEDGRAGCKLPARWPRRRAAVDKEPRSRKITARASSAPTTPWAVASFGSMVELAVEASTKGHWLIRWSISVKPMLRSHPVYMEPLRSWRPRNAGDKSQFVDAGHHRRVASQTIWRQQIQCCGWHA